MWLMMTMRAPRCCSRRIVRSDCVMRHASPMPTCPSALSGTFQSTPTMTRLPRTSGMSATVLIPPLVSIRRKQFRHFLRVGARASDQEPCDMLRSGKSFGIVAVDRSAVQHGYRAMVLHPAFLVQDFLDV